MSYETWETTNTAAMLAVLIAPLVLAVVVFLNRRQRRDINGKRNGRAVLWSFVTAFFSFLTFLIVWGLTLQEAFPQYSARWSAENAQRSSANNNGLADGTVVDGIVGQWRPNNRNRTDYFAFTTDTYSSINPEFDTTLTYDYEVLRRDGPCMRIRPIHVVVVQGGQITRDDPMRDDPFFVCVDPETDMMVMRFENSQGGDVFFVRMN